MEMSTMMMGARLIVKRRSGGYAQADLQQVKTLVCQYVEMESESRLRRWKRVMMETLILEMAAINSAQQRLDGRAQEGVRRRRMSANQCAEMENGLLVSRLAMMEIS